jgi:uncharacterized protein (DUF1800 family)
MNSSPIKRLASIATLYSLLWLVSACGGGQSSTTADPQSGQAMVKTQATKAPLTAQSDPRELTAAINYQRIFSTESTETAAPSLSAPSAARFLSQTSFGATDDEVSKVQAGWRKGWLQEQFALPNSINYFDRVLKEQNDWAQQQPTGKQDRALAPTEITDSVIWQSYITAPDQLRKRIGYSLSQILVVSLDGLGLGKGNNGLAGAAYLDVLEKHAFGNYKDLLREMTLNPAMGYYLSTKGNQRADLATGRVPDENYAREVMQLFTIGLVELRPDGTPKKDASRQPIPTYTQSDVTEMAKVFTGWDFDRSLGAVETYRMPMRLREKLNLSSPEDVNIFCKVLGDLRTCQTYSLSAGGSPAERLEWALIEQLFMKPNMGPFMAKQLIQRLVTSNPSPDYVTRVAAKFDDAGDALHTRGDMKAVIEAILLDEEALSGEIRATTSWGKLREPVLRFTQMARHLRMQSNTSVWPISVESDPAYGLGQSPLRSPSVFNFYRPGYTPPNNAKPKWPTGMVAPEFQITTETSVPGFLNRVHNFIATPPAAVTLDHSLDMALADTPRGLVNRLNNLFAHQSMTPATVDRIVAAVNAIPVEDTGAYRLQRARAALLLTMASPQTITLK